MALDTGNYISDLSRLNPTATDLVSEGDDVLRFVKKILQKTFPMGTDSTANTGVGPDQAVQVIIAKSSAPTIGGSAAESMGLVWLDTTTNLLKIRNQANDAWITLAVDPETSNSVDVNAGTIDGAVIGGTSAAACCLLEPIRSCTAIVRVIHAAGEKDFRKCWQCASHEASLTA